MEARTTSSSPEVEPVAFDQLDAAPGRVVAGATAREWGAEIVARATAEAEEIRQAAAAQGLEEGRTAGLAEARAALEPARDALAAAAEEMASALETFQAMAERRAVELALALAEKIIGASLHVNPVLVLDTIAGALRAAGVRDRLVLEVSPADLELVRGAVDDLTARIGGIHSLEVVADRRVPRGGCVVVTLEGEVDARAGEQLELARDVLLDTLADPDPDA